MASGNGPEPARGVLAEGERAVLNANPFEHVELAQGQRAAAHLADEDLAARLARRQRNGSPLIMVTP